MRKKILFLAVVTLFVWNKGQSQNNTLHFDGVNDYVDITTPLASFMTGRNAFSFETWIKPDVVQNAPYGMIFSANSNTNQLHRFVLRLSGAGDATSNTITLNIPVGGTSYKLTGTTNVMDGECHHIAWTYNKDTSRLYIDGVLQGTMIQSLSFQSTDKYSLGQEFDPPGYTPSDFFKGSIDECRIWDNAISSTQISDLMHTEILPTHTGLFAYFQCNQGTPGGNNTSETQLINAVDISSSGTLHNFSLTGSSSNFIEGSCCVSNYTEAPRNALHFDGVNDYVDITAPLASFMTGRTEFSFETWIKPDAVQNNPYGMIFSANSNTNQLHRFVLRLSGAGDAVTNSVTLNIPWSGSSYKLTGTTNVMDGECHHIAWTYNNDTSRLYIDGVLQGSMIRSLSFQSTDKYSLGQEFDPPGYTPSDFFKGSIDECRIWDNAISSTQISNLMNTEISPTYSGLFAYFQCNQGIPGGNNSTETHLINSVNAHQSGTLTNFTLAGSSSNFIDPNCCISSITSSKNALHFDGVNDYVDLTSSISYFMTGRTEFSFEVWIKPDLPQTAPYGMIFSANSDSESELLHRFVLRLSGDEDIVSNSVVLNIPSGGFFHKLTGTTNVMDGKCHHVAWTYNNGTSRLYIDGILQGTMNRTLVFELTDRFSLGQEFDPPGFTPSDFFKGSMDECRIWDHEISSTQITSFMNMEISPASSGLEAYFQFNQGISGGNNSGETSLNNTVNPSQSGTLHNFGLIGSTSNFVQVMCKIVSKSALAETQMNTLNSVDASLYPNPADNFFYISLPEKELAQIQVLNSSGQILLKQEFNFDHDSKRIETENLINGIYFVRIYLKNSNQLLVKKLVVNH
ncbi:hypothetical protein GCM10009118_10080 [Wandonia haliotis]|uniref:Secretion system C-terminal sorting domain-containing protein n=1 Tax=Wandonia haliotis TaxID=574963 RepID=A0ABN1MMT4_9FLAO